MKKFLTILLIGLALCSFTSCELLLYFLSGIDDSVDYESTVIENSDNENCFVVGYNESDENSISYNNSFYLEDYDDYASRSAAGSEETESSEEQNVDSDETVFLGKNFAHTDQILRNEIKPVNQARSARSAANQSVIAVKQPLTAISGEQRSFYIFDSNENAVEANLTCKYVGSKCVVWFKDDLNPDDYTATMYDGIDFEFTDSDFKAIADKFDTLCEVEEEIIGSHVYTKKYDDEFINPTDKINIVVYDIYGDATSGQSGGTFGYFRPLDMFNKDCDDSAKTSNEAQIINIDSYFYKLSANQVFSTLAHEYCHLLNFCNKTVQSGKIMSTWFTEMLAMTSEDMLQNLIGVSDEDSPKARLYQIFSNNGQNYYIGFIFSYNQGPIYWPDSNSLSVYSSYANAYALGAYLVRNFGFPNKSFDLLKSIATNAYVDEDAINQALIDCNQTYYTDSTKTNTAQCDFDYVMKNEYLILYNDNSSTEDQNNISLNKKYVYSENPKVYFDRIDVKTFTLSGYDSNSNIVTYNVKAYFNNSYADNKRSIGPRGFDIRLAGNPSKFVVRSPEYDYFTFQTYTAGTTAYNFMKKDEISQQ